MIAKHLLFKVEAISCSFVQAHKTHYITDEKSFSLFIFFLSLSYSLSFPFFFIFQERRKKRAEFCVMRGFYIVESNQLYISSDLNKVCSFSSSLSSFLGNFDSSKVCSPKHLLAMSMRSFAQSKSNL